MTTSRLRNISPAETTSLGLQAAGATAAPLPGITPDAPQHFVEYLSGHSHLVQPGKAVSALPAIR
jgi:hypothetical protein